MRLSKWQTAIITLLNVVIATLIIVIAVTGRGVARGEGKTDEPEPTGQIVAEPEHNKLRTAIDGKTPEILRETRLMGSGDETAVRVYFRGGVTYIFGNATVADFDFDSYGGFLCVVNGAGTILSFTYYSGRLLGVCDYGSGFAVAAGHSVYRTEYTGDSEIAATFEGDALDIFCADGGKIALVTQPTQYSFKLTEYAFSGSKLNAGRTTRIDSGYALKYFDCYDFGKSYVISARVSSLPRYDSLVFYSFAAGGDATAHYYGGDGTFTSPFAVMPFKDGYFAVAENGGGAAVLSVDYEFTSFHTVSLGFTCTSARLFYAADKYYACFERSDGAVSYVIEPDLKRTKVELGGMSIGYATKLEGTVLAGSVKSGEKRAVIYNGDIKTALDIVEPEFYGMTRYDGNTIVVLSALGGKALSAPTANRDLYVITMRN